MGVRGVTDTMMAWHEDRKNTGKVVFWAGQQKMVDWKAGRWERPVKKV